jgi:hypothetical protein
MPEARPKSGRPHLNQGCQTVCFQTKNTNLGKFFMFLQLKMSVYLMDTWSILRSFVIFYLHLGKLVVIWYLFPVLVFCTKKNLATLISSEKNSRIAENVFTVVAVKILPAKNMYVHFGLEDEKES